MDEIKINTPGMKLKMDPPQQLEQIKQISAKLHLEKDQDLIRCIRKISKRDRSGVYRAALRQYFGISGMK